MPTPPDMIPTNLPGVFALPPSGTDTSAELARRGMLRRPGTDAPAQVHEAWDRVFGQDWPPERRIVPHLVPRPGVVHRLRPDAETTANWAGGVVPGTWSTAIGGWQVPTVGQPNKPGGYRDGWDGSSWVGIDGALGSHDVLQAGVAQVIYRVDLPDGLVTYESSTDAWWEWYAPEVGDSPDYIHQTDIDNFEVRPGDKVWVSTEYTGTLPPAASTTLAGYETAFDDQLHVVYLSADGHVHEFVHADGWQHHDLFTSVAGDATPAARDSPLAGYATEFNQQQHVVYLDDLGHVHELVHDDGWQHHDLMAVTPGGAPPAAKRSPLHGYATTFNEQQHINYLDAGGHVHELYYDQGWHHNDLFQLSREVPTPAVPGSALTGYQTESDEQQHINYLDGRGHVHELLYTDEWHHHDLFEKCPELPQRAARGSALVAYTTAFDGDIQQHVAYFDANGHVHELVYKGSWDHGDLTISTGADLARVDSPMSGFASSWNNQHHLSYLGVDGAVREVFYQFGADWAADDVSASATWPDDVAALSPLAGYVSNNHKQHLNYVDADGHVHELYYADDGHWIHSDLSKLATVTGVIYFANERTMEHFAIAVVPPPGATLSGSTAEWIMEPPNYDGTVATLPRFSELTFTDAVCYAATGTPGDASQGTTMEVVEDGETVTESTLGPATVGVRYVGP